MVYYTAIPGHNIFNFSAPGYIWRNGFLHSNTAQDIEFNLDNFYLEDLTVDSFLKAEADIISATDYSPFGAPLAGRTFQASEYRFSFNGKEKLDEINGTGNDLDFGARIYDSRLGRWLAIDPKFTECQYVSPYKSQGNNPLIFADPDGKREYITTIIKEADGSNTIFRVLVSKKVMTDGVKHQIDGMNPASLFFDYEVRYYDFETTINFVRKSDGSLEQIGTPSKPQLIKDSNADKVDDVRTKKYGSFFELPHTGSNDIIVDFWDKEGKGGYQNGGIMFYTSSGGAMATKWKTKEDADVQLSDIEDVLTAFSGLRGSNVPKIKEILGTAEFASVIKDLKESYNNYEREGKKGISFKCEACGKLTNDTIATQREDKDRHTGWLKNH
jgi:RHS repeat-associated protein